MATLNLDALRAEAGLETHQLVLGGVTYELPAILPLGVAAAESNDVALAALFGEDADLDALKANLSMVRSDRPLSEFDSDNPQTDIDMICEVLYGIKVNEAPAPNREARRSGQNGKAKAKR